MDTPSKLEMAILRILWQEGSCTARQVQDHHDPRRRLAYTTFLKTLQRMTQKGLVRQDGRARTHRFEALLTEEKAQRNLLEDVLEWGFGGSRAKLVQQALSTDRATSEEIQHMRQVLDSLKEEKKSDTNVD